jgi:hypothetical protein
MLLVKTGRVRKDVLNGLGKNNDWKKVSLLESVFSKST